VPLVAECMLAVEDATSSFRTTATVLDSALSIDDPEEVGKTKEFAATALPATEVGTASLLPERAPAAEEATAWRLWLEGVFGGGLEELLPDSDQSRP
jgi:hypothetical protein